MTSDDDDRLIERIRASLAEHAAQIEPRSTNWADYVEHAALEKDRPPNRRPSRALVSLAVAATLVIGPAETSTAVSSSTSSAARFTAPVPTATAPVPPATVPPRPAPPTFRPHSVTFVSGTHGWVLGTAPCASASPCPAMAETLDGGDHWQLAAAPGDLPADLSSTGVRFADDHIGWVYGDGLWETRNGGTTWVSVTLPTMVAGDHVASLETGAGRVYALVTSPGDQASAAQGSAPVRVLRSAPGSDVWSVVLQAPGHASGGLVMQRGVVRLLVDDGAFTSAPSPCQNPVTLAAAGATEVTVVCSLGAAAGSSQKTIMVSHDSGASYQRRTDAPLDGSVMQASMADAHTIVIAASSGAAFLHVSADGGSTWQTTSLAPGGGSWFDLGFTTTTRGIAVLDTVEQAELLRSVDAGRSWQAVPFAY